MDKIIAVLILTVAGLFIYTLIDKFNTLVLQEPKNIKTEKSISN